MLPAISQISEDTTTIDYGCDPTSKVVTVATILNLTKHSLIFIMLYNFIFLSLAI